LVSTNQNVLKITRELFMTTRISLWIDPRVKSGVYQSVISHGLPMMYYLKIRKNCTGITLGKKICSIHCRFFYEVILD